ncbi:hypothetical protein MMC20_005700 [Loxospora ochrophaea]|nr:hypothetical protein [Loxospora ochrophaea]
MPPDSQHAARSPSNTAGASPAGAEPSVHAQTSTSASKKRRASATGSRGVANLTPEALAKKRANDREAQRAIRERTKNQIEGLERRIHDLTSQQPYQELQHVVRQKEAVEAENDDIKRRLASVMGLIQPLVADRALDELGAPAFHDPSVAYSSASSRRGTPSQSARAVPSSALPYPEPSVPSGSSTSSALMSSPHHLWQALGTLPLISVSRQPNVASSESIPDHPSNAPYARGRSISQEKIGFGHLLDRNPESVERVQQERPRAESSHLPADSHITLAASHAHGSVQAGKRPEGAEEPLEAHLVQVRNLAPTSHFDSLLSNFLTDCKQRESEGVSSHDLVGPSYPDFAFILRRSANSQPHPLSKLLADLISNSFDSFDLAERVAVIYVMFLLLRWQISPTLEHYNSLPDWLTPRPSQLFTPHLAWVDHVPWPRMRDRFVSTYRQCTAGAFWTPFAATLSLHWPSEAPDSLLFKSEIGELQIKPEFDAHLRDLSNWTLGPAFESSLPMMAGIAKVRSDGEEE